MISAFLRSLAALIRQLIASGKAVYVTEQTAKELELLAGLPWPERIKAADLALGWLLASNASADIDLRGDDIFAIYEAASRESRGRAAVCAELAVLVANMQRDWVDGQYHLYSAGLNCYAGTREGARAAWAFIVDAPLPAERAGELAREMGYTSIYPFAELAHEIGETYRRELEAMK